MNCGGILTDSETYTVLLERRAEREFRKLPSDVMARLDVVFRGLADNPRPSGAVKLSGQMGPGWRVRVGEYRVLYRVDDDQHRVEIYRIKHRREAYRP